MAMDLSGMVLKCAACGQCRSVCPSFTVSGNREHESPRGRVTLTRDLMAGKIPWTPGAVKTLSRCLLCSSCVEECPSDVPVDDVILAARRERIEKLGLPLLKRSLNGVFSRPGLLGFLARTGSLVPGTHGIRMPQDGLSRLIPSPARKSLRGTVRESGPPTFLFFRGCLVEHVTVDVGLALVSLARGMGEEPALPADEVCCGVPLLASGDVSGFQRLVARNIKAFGASDLPIVSACATCTAVLRKHYVKYAPEGMEEQARELSARVLDAVEFVADRDLPPAARHLGSLTYHQPCHHHKGLSAKVDGSVLLERAGAADYLPPSDRTACCGFGGSFSLDHYPEARALSGDRLRDLVATGAKGVATACPGCLIHLRDAISASGEDFRALHVLEVLHQAAARDR